MDFNANIAANNTRLNSTRSMLTTGFLKARVGKTMTTIWLLAVDTRAITTTVI
jgi:hypothetical protein